MSITVSKHKRGLLGWLLLVTAVGAAVVALLLSLAILFFPSDMVREEIEIRVGDMLEREVTLGEVDLAFSAIPTLIVKELYIGGESETARDLLQLGEARVSVDLFALLGGELTLGGVSLSDATLVVERDSRGSWSFESLQSSLKKSSEAGQGAEPADSAEQSLSVPTAKTAPIALPKLQFTNIKVECDDALSGRMTLLLLKECGGAAVLDGNRLRLDIDGAIEQLLLKGKSDESGVEARNLSLAGVVDLKLDRLDQPLPLSNLVDQRLELLLGCDTFTVADRELRFDTLTIKLDGEALRLHAEKLSSADIAGAFSATLPLAVEPIAELQLDLAPFSSEELSSAATTIKITTEGLAADATAIAGTLSLVAGELRARIEGKEVATPQLNLNSGFRVDIGSGATAFKGLVATLPGATLKGSLHYSATKGVRSTGSVAIGDYPQLAKIFKPWLAAQPLQMKGLGVDFNATHPAGSFDLRALRVKATLRPQELIWQQHALEKGALALTYNGERLEAQLQKLVSSYATLGGQLSYAPFKEVPQLTADLSLQNVTYDDGATSLRAPGGRLSLALQMGEQPTIGTLLNLERPQITAGARALALPKLWLKSEVELQDERLLLKDFDLKTLGGRLQATGVKTGDEYSLVLATLLPSAASLLKQLVPELEKELAIDNLELRTTLRGSIAKGVEDLNSSLRAREIRWAGEKFSALESSLIYKADELLVDITSLQSSYGLIRGLVKSQFGADVPTLRAKGAIERFRYEHEGRVVRAPRIDLLVSSFAAEQSGLLNYQLQLGGENLTLFDTAQKRLLLSLPQASYSGGGRYGLSDKNLALVEHRLDAGSDSVKLSGTIDGNGTTALEAEMALLSESVVAALAKLFELPLSAKGVELKLSARVPDIAKLDLATVALEGRLAAAEASYDYHTITALSSPFALNSGVLSMPQLRARVAEGSLQAQLRMEDLAGAAPTTHFEGSLKDAKVGALLAPDNSLAALLAGDASCSIEKLSLRSFDPQEIRRSLNATLALQLERGELSEFNTLSQSVDANQSPQLAAIVGLVQRFKGFEKWMSLPSSYSYSVDPQKITIKDGRITIPELALRSDNGAQLLLSGTIGADDRLDISCRISDLERFIAAKYRPDFKGMVVTEKIGGSLDAPQLLSNNFAKEMAKRIAIIQAARQLDPKTGAVVKALLGGAKATTPEKADPQKPEEGQKVAPQKKTDLEDIGRELLKGLFN